MITRVSIGLPAAALLILAATSAFASAGGTEAPPTGGTYSAAAQYDLGNAAARAGKSAEAVLDYERARLLDPRDPDIRANLQRVREQAGLPQPSHWFNQHARIADPNLMFWLGTFGIALAGASLLMRRSSETQRASLAAAAVVGLALTALSIADAIATASTLNEAVVMQSSPVTASPASAAEPLFTVAQADVVRMYNEYRNFVLVRDTQNREGWMARSALAPIIPRAATP